MPGILALRRQRQEAPESEASLGYTRSCLKVLKASQLLRQGPPSSRDDLQVPLLLILHSAESHWESNVTVAKYNTLPNRSTKLRESLDSFATQQSWINCWTYPIAQKLSWCIKTCNFPLELPPARTYRVGCITLREHTDTRQSPKKEYTLFPVSWKTSTCRGWAMLPTMKQSSRLGSHTAWNLVSHLPVIVLCLVGEEKKTALTLKC